MEALPDGQQMRHLYRSQESEVYLHADKVELKAKKMARVYQGLDLNIHYHPDKANIVADALSRKHYCNNLMVQKEQLALYEEMEKLSLEIVEKGQLNELRVKYTLKDQIRQAQRGCPEIEEVKT
jgi:hypothetical protein